jgi:chromosome partitioning protein
MTYVLAVSNQKGGVAKTTTALSLAAECARRGLRVLAVDLDPQSNLTLGLGLDPEGFRGRSCYDLLARREVSVAQVAQPVSAAGLDTLRVVPSEVRLAQAETELNGEVGFDELLKRKLRAAAGDFDVAVLDCPPSLSLLTVNALAAAALVLVPVQCEFFSAKGVVRLLELVGVVRERRNPELALRVVPTLYDARNNICRAVLRELKKQFPRELSRVAIGVDTRLREAAAAGLPIALFAPRSRASQAYERLAEEVLAHAEAA